MARPDYLTRDLTRAELSVLKTVIEALAPGLYVKCTGCNRFGSGGKVEVRMGPSGVEAYCEDCS